MKGEVYICQMCNEPTKPKELNECLRCNMELCPECVEDMDCPENPAGHVMTEPFGNEDDPRGEER